MSKELKKLIKYCEDNHIKVVFTDSEVLKDYSAMNPEAAKAMGFPDIDGKSETKEIEIDKNLPEEMQVENLKHELIEMRLMRGGMQYWDAHTIALVREKEPFDFSQPMQQKVNVIEVGKYGEERERNPVSTDMQKPKRRRWVRRFQKFPSFGIIKGG